MDDYLEEILDDIDFEQELMAVLDEDELLELSDDVSLIVQERLLSGSEISKHIS